MRYFVLLLVLFVSHLYMSAQSGEGQFRSCVKYVKEHSLYREGDEVNVMDLDLEWPEVVDNADIRPLSLYLSKLLFNVEDADLDSATGLFKSRFGMPVTAQFTTVPDDSKFCYVSCALREVGYLPGRFISFDASYVCSPGSGSSQKGDTISRFITYDLIYNKVLMINDIVKTKDIAIGNVPLSFLRGLLKNSSTTDIHGQMALNIQDAALADSSVLFRGAFINDDDYVPFVSSVELDDMRSLLTRNVKKLLKDKIPVAASNTLRMDTTLNGEPIYTNVDSMPTFRGGADSLKQYVLRNISTMNHSKAIGGQVRVIVSFVVDKNGYTTDVRVISAAAPDVNRNISELIKMMPKWYPAVLNGKYVNARMSMPIAFVIVNGS